MRVPAACHYPFATLAHKLSKQNNSVYISHIPHPPANKHTLIHTHTYMRTHTHSHVWRAPLFLPLLCILFGAPQLGSAHMCDKRTNEQTNKQTTATTIKTLMKCVQIFRKIYKHTSNDARQNRVLSRAAQCSTAEHAGHGTQDILTILAGRLTGI